MKRILLDDLKKRQLDILDTVAKFCDKNNINYFLDGGTLIGAVRHKGYIPWDDDIDLGMLRADYDKFIKLFNEANTRYKFHCVENDPDYLFPYGKIYDTLTVLYEPDKNGVKTAINIDIFVFDNAPQNDRTVKKIFIKRDILVLCNLLHTKNHKPRGNIFRRAFIYTLRLILWPFPKNYFAKKIVMNAAKYNSVYTGRIGNFAGWKRVVCSADILSKFTTAEFEGKIYKIPERYDEWLRLFYGDYMQLPPVNERISHHRFEAYTLEE